MNHVVNSILAPFGDPIESRPPVPTLEERLGMREEKRRAREERRKAKRREEVAGVESERVKGEEGKEGGENVVQEVKEAEEIQMRSAEGREESSVSEDEKAAKEAKEEAKEEAKGEDEAQKPKSWWRL